MEATNLCKHTNHKENVPPFSSKQANPIIENVPFSSSKKGFRRRVRRPLEDITYFYGSCIQLALAEESESVSASFSVTVSSYASNSKKRKASDEENDRPNPNSNSNSKSLRFGFR
ncbi:conserved hypothetical protein [Ricinus communis]|uniref:Uncharacterized protein n=1 Tax=Ricinus communis TaxID=3988 RepID=B9SGL7_RICCO|nr:conserved hypothetical protein [Ricinus communis]